MIDLVKDFRSRYSKEVQVYTLFFVIHMMRKTIFNQGRAMGDTSVNGGTFLMLFCIVLNFWIVYRNTSLLSEALRGSKLFLGYVIVSMFSFFWAIIPAFGTVVLKDMEILSSFLAIATVVYMIENKKDALLYICILFTCSSSLGVINSLRIGEMHTNSYTLVGGMGTLLALGLRRSAPEIHYIKYLIVINAIALVVGTSSASYISFILGFLIYLSARKNQLKLKNIVIMAILAYVVFPYIETTLYQYVFYGHSEEAIKGGTGRFEVWGMFIEGWKKSPWLGYGYVIGERSFGLITHTKMVVFSAHNGYLSVLLGTGLLGMAFFAPYLIKLFYKNYTSCKNSDVSVEHTIIFSALVMLLFNNSSYPAIGSDWNYTFPPIMAMLCLINQLETKADYYLL